SGRPRVASPGRRRMRAAPVRFRRLLVLDLVEHQRILDLVEEIHGADDRVGALLAFQLRLLEQGGEGRAAAFRKGGLLSQVQHLQLVQQLVYVAHLVAPRGLQTARPRVAFGGVVDRYTGFFKHVNLSAWTTPTGPFYGRSALCQYGS